MVLAAKCDASDRTLDWTVVEIDTAIVQEAAERWPAREGITDRLGEAAAARNATKLRLEPRLHGFDERPRLGIAHGPAPIGSLSSDGLLDCIELGDPA